MVDDSQTSGEYATSWKQVAIRFKGFKKARKLVRDLLLSSLAAVGKKPASTFLRCITCHYVFDDQREEFRAIIQSLKEIGTFIDTPTCLEMLKGTQQIDGRFFHLSFDDGFRNIVSNAIPTLETEGVPAIIFVPTDFVGANWKQARDYAVGVAKYRAPVEIANWDDLRTIAEKGFEVGSHTCTHARLSQLSGKNKQLQNEISGSKKQIEDQLSTPCKFIAYPFGKPGDYDQVTLETTREAGYEGGFGIHRGSIIPGETDPMLIPRHHFEPEWPLSHIRLFANGNLESYWSNKMKSEGIH